MRLRVVTATVAAVLAGFSVAQAHPPYEGKARVLKTKGGDIEVVKSYVDGILGTDPPKIVVRSQGIIHAETEYHRDTSLVCVAGRCFIAAADSPFAVIPERVWVLDGTSLRSVDSLGVRLLGSLVHLWDHLFGYGIALFFLVVLPFIAIWQATRIGRHESGAAGCLATIIAAGVVGVLVVWFYVVLALSELSMTWALLLGAILFIGVRAVRA
jgi:hypothetical protein